MQNIMMVWVSAHSDCIGVTRDVTVPRRNDKVKRRTTFFFAPLLSQYLLPFSTQHAHGIHRASASGPTKKKHRVTIDWGAEVG